MLSSMSDTMAVGTIYTKPESLIGRYRALVFIGFLNIAIVALWYGGMAPNIAVEDGVLETLQLLLAAGAFAAFMFTALEDEGPIGTSGTAIAAICAIAVVREIDVRKIVVPDWMMIWAYGPFRDTTVGVLLLLVILYAIVRRAHFKGWLSLLFRWRAWPFWLSGILLTSSMALDGGKIVSGKVGVLVEEMVEMNGCLLLLIAGWRHCQLLIKSEQD